MEVRAPAAALQARDLSRDKVVSFILWRIPWLLVAGGFLWSGGRGIHWSLALEWFGAACTANALRCGRVHCAVMGPLFLLIGSIAFAKTLGWLSLDWTLIWSAAGITTILGFVPEFLGKKYFGKDPAC